MTCDVGNKRTGRGSKINLRGGGVGIREAGGGGVRVDLVDYENI